MTTQSHLILEQMEVGPMQNFIYFLGDKSTGEIAVVDPAWDVAYLRERTRKRGYTITHIFLTHGHPDHVNGLDDLLSTHDVPVYISENEAPFYTPRCKNLIKVSDRQKLNVGSISFECIFTPGHTPGCQCFKSGDALIAGDTLFIDGCGRCDLPGGDPKMMYLSLRDVIMNLPIRPSFIPGTTTAMSPSPLWPNKKTNPYLQSENLQTFLHHRMGVDLAKQES